MTYAYAILALVYADQPNQQTSPKTRYLSIY